MMFMNIFMKIKICMILLIIQKTKSFETVNKKVISKMKDEFKTKIISEFVGLKLKVHSLIDVDNEKEKVQIS